MKWRTSSDLMLNKLRSQSEFTKNVLTLVSGTAVAQFVPLLIAPILTRIYTPDDFGLLAIFTSLASLLAIVATGRYEVAIVLPQKDEDAKSLFALSLLIALGVSVLSGLIVLLGGTQISVWYDAPSLTTYLYLIPAAVFLAGVFQSLSYYATRNKAFANLSYSKVGESLSGSLVKVGLGISKIGAGGLIVGNLTGAFVSSLILFRKLWRSNHIRDLFGDKANILAQGRLYSDFLKINTIHAFSDVLQAMLLIFFLTSFFGTTALGFYAFASRIIKTPLSIVAGSVTQVFYQKSSEKYASGLTVRPLVMKMVRNLSLGFAPIFAVLLFFGPPIFAFVFGDNWRIAGEFAQILAPWMFVSFVVVPISQIPVVVHKQKENFLISLFGHALVIGAVIYGGTSNLSVETTLMIISASQTIFLALVIAWIINISGIIKETSN